MHPHFEFGGTPPLLYPCLGTAGTYWVPQGGKLRLIWSLSPCGTPVLSLLVANPISALQLLGGQRKRGALCLLPSPGDPPPTVLPICPPSVLPISVMVQQNCLHPMGPPPPTDPQGLLGHLPAPLGMQRGLGGSWHLLACWEGGPLGFFGMSRHVEERLLGSWHLQHVRGDIRVL